MLFEIKINNINNIINEVNETSKQFKNLIIKDKLFYNKDGNFEQEKAKKVFFKAFNDYMKARMLKKKSDLAPINEYIKRNYIDE